MGLGRLFGRGKRDKTVGALPAHLRIEAGSVSAAAQLEAGIGQQGYDELARRALSAQAEDFVQYHQEACGRLSENSFDIAFFRDGSALILYQTTNGLVLHATSSEEAEQRLQDEKTLQGRFAGNWRQRRAS